MQLRQLIEDLAVVELSGDLGLEVRALACHSERVRPEGVFVAIRGSRHDGHEFVSQAVERGARALVVERPCSAAPGVCLIRVPSTREALACLACRFYGFPSRELTVVGITGTNGKTTTAYLLESILAAAGLRVGVIGTVDIRYPGHLLPAAVTTPESLDLQRTLRGMLDAGVTHVVMEVSSHGLDMHRVDGTRFALGLFTNLSQDHLDYHGSMERYFAAKSLLFSHILRSGGKTAAPAVINADDPWAQRLAKQIGGPLLRFGLAPAAEIRAEDIQCDFSGIKALLHTPRGKIRLHSSLLGRLNLYNLLAASAAAVALEVPLPAIQAGHRSLGGIPGRLEPIPTDLGFQVLVDYAHTPDALANALASVRELGFRRIICVFGCGGDRDRGKRPLMGAAAAQGADLVVVTSDNPRGEAPEAIMAEIEAGIRPLALPRLSCLPLSGQSQERGYILVADRAQAIRLAIAAARKGDAVYLGGKGHEDYQIIGDRRLHFDDRELAIQALAERSQHRDAEIPEARARKLTGG